MIGGSHTLTVRLKVHQPPWALILNESRFGA